MLSAVLMWKVSDVHEGLGDLAKEFPGGMQKMRTGFFLQFLLIVKC